MVNEGAVADPTLQPGPLRACQKRQTPSPAGSCYGPDQIRVAYGFAPLLAQGINGAGRTIVIIDAYGSNTLTQDLGLFNGYFGLPSSQVNVIYPDGTPSPTTAANAFGWKAETTLDVEWAHAIAPAATIDLVVAKSNDDGDILSATKYVSDHNLGDVVSQSFGEAEQCMNASLLAQQHALFDRMTAQGITLLASSGDQGAALPSCDGNSYIKAASTPATDPNVTAVGGTQLIATPATGDANNIVTNVGGVYQSENAWNEGVGSSTGGGVSSIFARPDYQAPVVKDTHMREVPDVAYNAAVNGGVLGALTCGPSECGLPLATYFFRFGGTSAGSPQWAGLVALADQMAGGRLGALNKTLYHLGQRNTASTLLHDVTLGNNSVPADPSVPGTPITGFAAVTGYDEATGWGSPIASVLVPALAKPGQG
jgi:subtilase family serine protease